MANEDSIRDIVTRACCDALQQKSRELAEEVARRASEELARMAEEPAPPSSPTGESHERTKELLDGVLLVAGSRTQSETLDALLAAVSAITPACGLMILRGTQASGWNCNGLVTLESFKRTTMDCAKGAAANVIGSCAAAVVQASELDTGFRNTLGLEGSAHVLLVPISLKGRVAALLIALPQVALSQHSDELAGAKLLVQVTQLTLELQAARRAAPHPPAEHASPAAHRDSVPAPKPEIKEPEAAPQEPEPEPAYEAVQAAAVAPMVPSFPEPVYAATAPARTPDAPQAPVAQIAAPAPQWNTAMPHFSQPLPDEVHEKARRFAKLLVDEIKLYNQTKLAEGRARGDLYSRLRDDIEKSRGAYQKRYGESVRDVDYFTQELLRILADNNRAVMGPGFPG